MTPPKDIDAYLATVAPEARAALESVRKAIHAAAPGAAEGISWGMPSFKVDGKIVAGIAAFKAHCSYFPYGHEVLELLQEELKGYELTKGTIHFPFDRPLPRSLVAKLVKARIRVSGGARPRRTAGGPKRRPTKTRGDR